MSQEAGHPIFKGNIQHFDLRKDDTALRLHSRRAALLNTGKPGQRQDNLYGKDKII